MGFEIFSEVNKLEHFFPKFNMSIDAHSDDVVCFGRCHYVVDGFLVHEADFVEIGGGQPIEQQFMILDWIGDDVLFCILRRLGPMPSSSSSFLFWGLFLLSLGLAISFSYYFSI